MRHMDFFLQLPVVTVLESLTPAHLETAARKVSSYVGPEHVAAVPLDAVTLLEGFKLHVLVHRCHLFESLLV